MSLSADVFRGDLFIEFMEEVSVNVGKKSMVYCGVFLSAGDLAGDCFPVISSIFTRHVFVFDNSCEGICQDRFE